MNPTRLSFHIVAVALLLTGAGPSGAQAAPRQAGARPTAAAVDTAPACCTIVRVDSIRAEVTARELATGFTFMFAVKSRRLLRALRPGLRVWADFSRKTVRLSAEEREPCCTLLPSP